MTEAFIVHCASKFG